MTDEKLFKILDTIEKLEAPYCILNNTLLSIYRDGKLFPQEEKEAVILLPSVMRFHVRNHPLFKLDIWGVSGLGNVNLDGRICVIFFTEIGDKFVMNSWLDNFIVVDKSTLLPFMGIEYKGRIVPVPHDIEKYLTVFYGDWKTPVPEDKWDWINSKGIIKASSLWEAFIKSKKE